MIDHCISAFRKLQEDKTYRTYITDALFYLARLNIRYADAIKPVQAETRSANEIISDISKKLEKAQKGGLT